MATKSAPQNERNEKTRKENEGPPGIRDLGKREKSKNGVTSTLKRKGVTEKSRKDYHCARIVLEACSKKCYL